MKNGHNNMKRVRLFKAVLSNLVNWKTSQTEVVFVSTQRIKQVWSGTASRNR